MTRRHSIAVAGRRFFAGLLLGLITSTVAAQNFSAAQEAYQTQDYERALELLLPLAEQGDSEAQVMLGLMYEYGHGVETDPETAIQWYTRAARQGLPVVQHDLGVKYFQGKGVARDYGQAMRWWQMAANAGLADSQFNLGLMYYRGLGVAQDYTKARELFRQAADQGHANAQYSLAVMYAFSQGVAQDYEHALRLFRQAAEQGIAQAQYNLGVFYENGHGIDKNLDRARHWYRKAADQNVDKAAQRLAALTGSDQPAAAAPASATTAGSATADAVDSSTTLQRDDWLLARSADHYTIQLISLTDEQSIKQYLHEHALTTHAGYIEVRIDGERRYNAIYGDYSNYDSAQAAIGSLPTAVQRGQPWVRNFGVLQKLMP